MLFEDLYSSSESGIRISAELHRGGFVENVTFRRLRFDWQVLEKKSFLLHLEQNYDPSADFAPCVYPNGTKCPIPHFTPKQTTPVFDGIRFENITVVRAPRDLEIGRVNCSIAPCHNIAFDGVHLLDAPQPQAIKCTGVHGSEVDVDRRAWGTTGCVTSE